MPISGHFIKTERLTFALEPGCGLQAHGAVSLLSPSASLFSSGVVSARWAGRFRLRVFVASFLRSPLSWSCGRHGFTGKTKQRLSVYKKSRIRNFAFKAAIIA